MFANSKWKDSVLSLLTLLLFGTIFLPLLKAQQPTEASSASLNYKQLGAAMMAYAADHSDQLPLGYSYNNASQLWRHSSYCIVPEGWLAGRETEPRRTEDASQWANATRIYYKDLRAL